jgi:hypothetical protein
VTYAVRAFVNRAHYKCIECCMLMAVSLMIAVVLNTV